MIVDTSAIMAILRREPEASAIAEVMLAAATLRLSAGTWLELAAVTTRSGDRTVGEAADRLLDRFGIIIEDVTKDIATVARNGYRQYGRGTKHEARLNYGDCFSYALAKVTGEALLFKGNDFSKTDVVAALAPK